MRIFDFLFSVPGGICLITIISIILVTGIIIRYYRRYEKKHLERVANIHYTQILPTGGDNSVSITKFLVVYLSGESEIISVHNNSRLCKEYSQRLKTDDGGQYS